MKKHANFIFKNLNIHRNIFMYACLFLALSCVPKPSEFEDAVVELEGASTEEIESNSFVQLTLSSPASRFGLQTLVNVDYSFTVTIDPKGEVIKFPEFILPLGITYQGSLNQYPGFGNCPQVISTSCTVTFTYTSQNSFEYKPQIGFRYLYRGRGYLSKLDLYFHNSNALAPVRFCKRRRLKSDVPGYIDNTCNSLYSDGYYYEYQQSIILNKISKGAGRNMCAIGDGGQIKCWGEPWRNNLGTSSKDSFWGDNVAEMGHRLNPLSLETEVLKAKIFDKIGCILNQNYELKCWGHNNFGGTGSDNIHSTNIHDLPQIKPLDFGKDLKVVDFDLGKDFGCAVLEKLDFQKIIKCWGKNDRGQLGAEDTFELGWGQLVSVGGVIRKSQISLDSREVQLGHNSPIKKLVTGRKAACVLFMDGNVKCWGDNTYGQLGQENLVTLGDNSYEMGLNLPFVDLGVDPVSDIFAGDADHFCAQFGIQELKCWGRNDFGQLGQGSNANIGDASAEMGIDLNYIQFDGAVDIHQVKIGRELTCVSTHGDKRVSCFGKGEASESFGVLKPLGSLGLGNANNIGDGAGEMGAALAAVDLGSDFDVAQILGVSSHVCVLSTADKIKCFGDNTSAQLGIGTRENMGDENSEMGDNLDYLNIPSFSSVDHFFQDSNNSCAILDKTKLICWGSNRYALINPSTGLDLATAPLNSGASLQVIPINNQYKAIQVTVGDNHACALFDNNKVKCWGENKYGQLGQGDTIDRIDLSTLENPISFIDLGSNTLALSIHAGKDHTCARTTDKKLKCWGRNNYGQLGLEDSDNRGDASAEMGDNLSAINFGVGSDDNAYEVTDFSSGLYHNCAILTDQGSSDEIIKCWGKNSFGQLGQGSSFTIGDDLGEMGDNLSITNIDDKTSFNSIKLGHEFSCASHSTNRIYCWGKNDKGQLGIGSTISIGDNGSEMGDDLNSSSFVTSSLYWSVGADHVCNVDYGFNTYCWGDGENTGREDGVNLGIIPGQFSTYLPTRLRSYYESNIVEISSGAEATCVVYADGLAQCWGKSPYLGNGLYQDFGSYEGSMSINLPYLWF